MDKLSFARLIAYLVSATRYEFTNSEIEDIDRLAVLPKPPPPPPQPAPSPAEVRFMLSAMRDGRKIEAIKSFRTLTGDGLKESKDEIEAIMGMFRGAV